MLIVCSECGLQVSDKALTCPHCGFPMKPDAIKKVRRGTNKRRRLPNGFGQISEIKGRNLRKPFRVLVPAGKATNGHPISKPLKPISYFSTYNEAYQALIEYHNSPIDLNESITVLELYEKWSVEYYESIKSRAQINSIKRAWKFCSSVYDIKVTDLRVRHIKACIEEGVYPETNEPTNKYNKNFIKTLFNLMLDYAMENEYIEKNPSRMFALSDKIIEELNTTENEHIPYTDEEMNKLWSNVESFNGIDMILIQCYSGWRPRELCALKISNVDLENRTFIGGMKSKAGTNRTVPIHSKIFPFVEKRYNAAIRIGSDFLFNNISLDNRAEPFTYNTFKNMYDRLKIVLKLDTEHRPHDGRKHFVTMAKKYNLDEYAIKYIVGHAINDITEKIYTQRDKKWLSKEIEKIKD
ncbi:MAG: tyrosine-type recombinase/integrase [Clostridia bacterium]|nr:tyrosine-type recombinase/integrase [Clostridia bacterium]